MDGICFRNVYEANLYSTEGVGDPVKISLAVCGFYALARFHNRVMASSLGGRVKFFAIFGLSIGALLLGMAGVAEAIGRLAIAIITAPYFFFVDKKCIVKQLAAVVLNVSLPILAVDMFLLRVVDAQSGLINRGLWGTGEFSDLEESIANRMHIQMTENSEYKREPIVSKSIYETIV